jgi:hypothetical protein
MRVPVAHRASYFAPPPPGAAATQKQDFCVQVNGVHHVDDPTGANRRYFEGWASLDGLDMQDMEIAADACKKGAAKYLQRNPVIVWHHQANMPIGRVLSLTFTPQGMYMTGEIHRMDHILDKWAQYKDDIPLDSIAMKCEEVWQGIVSGSYRGLSIRGGVRQVMPVYSPELDKPVPRVLEVELYEISVTPISIHPGTKITKVNTVAKALSEAVEIVKALPCQPQQKGDRMSVIQEAWAALQAAIEAEAKENNGAVELPEEVAKGLHAYGSAVDGVDPEPADRIGHSTLETPKEAKVRPTGAPQRGELSPIEKALKVDAPTVYMGRTQFGEGDAFGLPESDVYKLHLMMANNQGHMSLIDGVNLSPKAKQHFANQ